MTSAFTTNSVASLRLRPGQSAERSQGHVPPEEVALAVCVTLVVIVVLFWRRINGPAYEGRTVEQWFKLYHASRDYTSSQHLKPDPDELKLVKSAFRRMGTNAVPFLVGRITRYLGYSSLELWRFKYRRKIPQTLSGLLPMPVSKNSEASSAANVLSALVKPPGEMPRLKEMLAAETDEGRKRRIAHASQYISESGPAELRKD
jgi:hypothetical protein